MGISVHVQCLTSPEDVTYQKKLKVLIACQEAKITPPREIEKYFEDGIEGPLVQEIKVNTEQIGHRDIYDVLVDDIPRGAHTIRFVISC